MKKKLVWMLTAGMIVGAFGGCGQSEGPKDAISIQLSDAGITVDGIAISTDENADVYAANDIVLILLWIMATVENISYLSVVVCFAAFFVNDVYGYVNWKKMERHQTSYDYNKS